MEQIEIISPSGKKLKASAKAFELIYKAAGYAKADDVKTESANKQPKESAKKAASHRSGKK